MNRKSRKRVFILVGLMLATLISTFLKLENAAIAIQTLIAFYTSYELMYMVKIAKRKIFKSALVFASISILAWSLEYLVLSLHLSDFGWKINLTLFPELFLLVSLSLLIIGIKVKASPHTIMLDIFAIGGIWIFSVYILFIQNHNVRYFQLPLLSQIAFASVFLDILSLTIITIILYFSIRKKYQPYLSTILSGLGLFAFIDILYLSHNFNIVNHWHFILIMWVSCAFLLVLWGVFIGEQHPEAVFFRKELTSDTSIPLIAGKSVIVTLAPILVFATHPAFIKETFGLITAVIVYLFLSESLRIHYLRKDNLMRQKEDNRYLEEQVAMRSEELRQKREMLERISNFDPVTGLFNRQYFQFKLNQMAESLGVGEELVLYYIDMDKFKSINDTYGHAVGDQVLKELGSRISQVRGNEGLKARLGGDEFTLVFKVLRQSNFILNTTHALQSILEHEVTVGPLNFRLAMSIGVTVYPKDAQSIDILLRNADIAMYRAKELGNNQCFYYDAAFGEAVNRRNELAIMLQNADIRHDFALNYQPLLDCEGHLTGVEAFCRWNIEGRGWVMPDEFIPLAEEIGVIVALGNWILENTAQQIRVWNRRYHTQLKMSVNLSYRQLNVADFVETLLDDLRRYGVDAGLFDLEIKESVAMNPDLVNITVGRLVNEGIRVSIDEFGTGYSSLIELSRLRVHRIKISRELIANIADNQRDQAILRAIVKFAKAMGFEVYIKGVESQKQYEILKSMEVDGMQGYYFTAPLTCDDFEDAYLKSN